MGATGRDFPAKVWLMAFRFLSASVYICAGDAGTAVFMRTRPDLRVMLPACRGMCQMTDNY